MSDLDPLEAESSRIPESFGNDSFLSLSPQVGYPQLVPGISGCSPRYSEEEKKVLWGTSRINGVGYLPYSPLIDLKLCFKELSPFTDEHGLLPLSPKQEKAFCRWTKPSEIWPNPRIFSDIDPLSTKQTVISDCSFVSSLSVGALFEKRFGRRLITSGIFPQEGGVPVYNACGKYLVKLFLNGIWRKVIIDDLLPVGNRGELLCSYSTKPGELWVSILEKAYMKVMGGYDFPGSNSDTDLHALTGWIPERLSIHERQSDNSVFQKEETFFRLHSRFRDGNVLITIGTGEMTPDEAKRTGLVPRHAYAVLDIQEKLGLRLFLLKNPWSRHSWTGDFSDKDTVHWTEELKREFNYDPARKCDNGVFWIDYDSVLKFFSNIYMSWNPSLFPYTDCIHRTWNAGDGPIKDSYTIAANPQYKLEIRSEGPAVIWCLLTRHITEIEDFKDNREYITTLVYDLDGKRVYYPYHPPPIVNGRRINSPHYLCKLTVSEATTKRYTLVVSQFEKFRTIHFTLQVYSSCPFTLEEIRNLYKFKHQVTGEWRGKTAGGCSNHETYNDNPRYQLTTNSELNGDTSMVIELRGPRVYGVGFKLVSNVGDTKTSEFFRKSSGPFRKGIAILELENVPSGVYNIIPSTFQPECEGPFVIVVESTCDFSIKKL